MPPRLLPISMHWGLSFNLLHTCPSATLGAEHETHLVFREAWCNLSLDIAYVVFPLMHVPLKKSVVFKCFNPKCFTDVTCVLCMKIVCNFCVCSIWEWIKPVLATMADTIVSSAFLQEGAQTWTILNWSSGWQSW